jgi:hypothetical protein
MLHLPLWTKILFFVCIIAFIFVEAAWDRINEWAVKQVKSLFGHSHFGHRLGPHPH